MIDTIEREILIAAPVARVWEIVTTPEHMGRWFGDAGAERHVEFTLTPEGDGTRLRVVESGWASLATSASERERLREGNAGGWAHELGDLERYAQSVAV